MKKKIIAGVIVYVALLILCLVVIYAVPSVKGLMEKTYIAEYSGIDITDEVSAFIVRDEIVYVAAQDSEINRLAETDKLVKAGTRIVELTPIPKDEDDDDEEETRISRKYVSVMESLGDDVKSVKKGVSRIPGYVSYYVDGAEASLLPSRLDKLKKKDLEALAGLKAVETPSRKCLAGEPVFKIIRNSRWYLVFYIDKAAAEKYYEGRTVNVKIAGRDVPVRVDSVETGKRTARVTLSCKMFFEGFFEERSLTTTVTVASAEGLLLKDSSIVENGDGQKGVFVKNKLGRHVFKPIAVKADDGTQCVVYSDLYVDEGGNYVETLKTYDEIVEEPTGEDLAGISEKTKTDDEDDAAEDAAE